MRRAPDGAVTDLLPAGMDARTAVHEYGGGAWWVRAGVVWFANWADQRLYRLTPGADPEPITPEPGRSRGARFADGADGDWGALVLEPAVGEPVVAKQYASAFFGTSLAATLHAGGVDTVVIAGVSTSGCIRATATDALNHGFRPQVVRDACADRTPDLHDQNLSDLDAKYADVTDLPDALSHLRS
ncbi:MAG: isochorismatase family protein [Pseudonocardia sp.]|nr:isochorismatase family protein [Pseudonocardia sp.]